MAGLGLGEGGYEGHASYGVQTLVTPGAFILLPLRGANGRCTDGRDGC